MNSGIKKRLLVWAAAVVVTAGSCFAQVFTNKILDIQFEEGSNGVVANVITDKQVSAPVRATKSGQYYNIILPNFDKGAFSTYSPGGLIESVRLTLIPSSSGGDSYIRVQIKPVPGVIVTAKSTLATDEMRDELLEKIKNLESSSNRASSFESDENSQSESSFDTDYYERIIARKQRKSTLSQNQASEMVVPEEKVAPVISDSPENSVVKKEAESSGLQTAPTTLYEKILWAIGVLAIFSIVGVLYLKGRQEMDTICGDMSVDITDDSTAEAKKKAKQKAKEEKEKKAQEKKEALEKKQLEQELARLRKEVEKKEKQEKAKSKKQEKHNKLEKVVAAVSEVSSTSEELSPQELNNQLIQEPIEESSVTQPVEVSVPEEKSVEEEEDYDVDDFLSSFVDADDEEEFETAEQTKVVSNEAAEGNVEEGFVSEEDENADDVGAVNLIDDLIDDVISTQEMTFSEADMAAIQERLQADLSPEMLENLTQALNATIPHQEDAAVEEAPAMTIEQFDELFPEWSECFLEQIFSNENIKFNDVDLDVVYKALSSFEMPESAILDARLQKKLQEEENIQYYESEHDFAFTLIKPQEVENLEDLVVINEQAYPDLENADFSGDAILKEFSFAAQEDAGVEDLSDEAPTIDDIERVMQGIKLVEMSADEAAQYSEKPEPEIKRDEDNSILSEFHLIKPAEEPKKEDEHFTQTVFTSMDDISAQFKALGLDFDEDSSKAVGEVEQVSPVVEEPLAAGVVEEQFVPAEQSIEDIKDVKLASLEDAEIYAKFSIDDSSELMIAYYQDKTSLIGVKNGVLSTLYEFEDGQIPSSLSARKAEITDDGVRYIVRAAKYKFVVEVASNDIKLVMVL